MMEHELSGLVCVFLSVSSGMVGVLALNLYTTISVMVVPWCMN